MFASMVPVAPRRVLVAGLALCASMPTAMAKNYTQDDMLKAHMALLNVRAADDCPPCFNCLLPAYTCGQYAQCNEYNGQCECPAGFGGDACLEPSESCPLIPLAPPLRVCSRPPNTFVTQQRADHLPVAEIGQYDRVTNASATTAGPA